MAEDFSSTLHIAEGGFRPRPERLDAYIKRHEQFMPHAVAQAGFRETYGGPIAGTSWWLFFAKFDTLEAMEDWQRDREHVKVQDEAREKWWTAYYIRKGRILADNETATGIILNETMLLRDTPLSDTESDQVSGALSDIASFGILPYEALKNERLQTPYVFTQVAGIVPQRAPVHYVLLSSWGSTAECRRWQQSAGYETLCGLGTAQSTCYQIIPERKPRMGLHSDRMQREWVAAERS